MSQKQPSFESDGLESYRAHVAKEAERISRKKRFRRIVRILTKHGILYELKDRSPRDEVRMRKLGQRLKSALEELGPVFIKLGQVLVTRQELLPEAVTEALQDLLDNVPALPFPVMATVLSDELPQGLQSFSYINPKPLASASLAQVYQARWHDGRPVAVKIVRPLADKIFQTDITIIRRLVRLAQKFLPPEFAASVDLKGIIQDYYSSSLNELDMFEEARSMEEHRKVIEAFETLHIPEVYFVSKHVLVMEYIDGWTLKDFPVDFLTFEERFERMMDLAHYYIQTFLKGNYHADPHGSNIMVDRHTKKAVFLDWGMVGRMDAIHTEAIFRMLMQDRLNQAEDAAESALDIIQPTEYTDPVKLKDDLRSMLIRYVTSNQASQYNWGNLVISIIALGIKHHCRIPNGLALWAKGFSAAEGTARWLCPEISYHTVVESAAVPIIRSWLQRRFDYRANGALLTEAAKLVTSFPRRANLILEHLAWNSLKLNLSHQLHPTTVNIFQKSVNRLVLAFLAGFSFIGSAILLASPVSGGRAVGIGGVWVSGVLSIYLVWRIVRSKRA